MIAGSDSANFTDDCSEQSFLCISKELIFLRERRPAGKPIRRTEGNERSRISELICSKMADICSNVGELDAFGKQNKRPGLRRICSSPVISEYGELSTIEVVQ